MTKATTTEDRGKEVLQNVDILHHYMASQPTRPGLVSSSLL